MCLLGGVSREFKIAALNSLITKSPYSYNEKRSYALRFSY